MNKTKNNPRISAPNDKFRHRQVRFHASPTPEFYTTKDVGCRKRVKSSAPEKDGPTSCRLEGYDIPSERGKKVTTCAENDPKTSEYAFFKKLKKDAGLRFRSCPLQKDDSLPKKPEQTEHPRERTDDIRVGNQGFSASRLVEGISTVKTDTFFSPSDGTWNKSDLYSVSSIQKNSQGFSDTFKPQGLLSREGNQYVHGEIFSRKRQKLRQCVADALFPDPEKFSLKGRDDIVSMLLGRLFPVSIEENKYEDRIPWKEVDTTGYDLPDSRESDVQFKELNQPPSSKLLEQSSSYFSDNLLSPMLLSSDERISAHHAFPSSHSRKFQPPYSTTEPKYKCDRIPSVSAKRDVTLGFLHKEGTNATGYGLLDPQKSDIRFKEHHQIPETRLLDFEPNPCIRDQFLSPILLRSNDRIIPEDFPTSRTHKFQPLYSMTEHDCDLGRAPSFSAKSEVTLKFLLNDQEHDTFALNHYKEQAKLKREPIPLLLEKEFDCPPDEVYLPIAYKSPKPDLVPGLSNLCNGEEQMPQDIASILDSGLLRYQGFRFGKYVYEEEDDMDSNFNHTFLPLSHNKHHFKLSADGKNDTNSCDQDSFHLSPYQHWIRRTAYNDYHHHHHPDSEAWLSSSINFISGQRCLSLTNSHSNNQGSNSCTLQLAQRERMSSPFHVNDISESEMDGGNQGEVLFHFRQGLIEICNSSFLHMSMQRQNGCSLPLDRNDYINELDQTRYDPL